MLLGEFSIDCMSHIWFVSQRLQGISMDQIIPLFEITSIYHNR